MSHLRAFGRFWWNFIVGDDWLVAAGVALALGLTDFLTRRGVDALWLLPLAVVVILAVSLRRATQSDVR